MYFQKQILNSRIVSFELIMKVLKTETVFTFISKY